MARGQERNAGGVKVLEKGLAILGLFDELKPEWGASEVAKQLGGSVASAHRMLHTLAAAGYLTQLPSGRFSLGEASLVLGRKAQRAMDIGALLRPDLQELSESIGETAMVATRGDEPGYLVSTEMVESAAALRIAPAIGSRISLTDSAVGQAFLAYLEPGDKEAAIRAALDQRAPVGGPPADQIRASIEAELAVVEERQFARSPDDDEAGVWEVASPIRASDGAPIAVIAVTGPMFPESRRPGKELGPAVVAAAAKAEARISNWHRGVRLGQVRESMGTSPGGGPDAVPSKRLAEGRGGSWGVLKIGHTVAIETLNPLAGVNISTMKVLAAVYPMLVNQDPEGQIVGDFAKGWTQSDEKTITFVTHDDGKWTDGEPLTAHDAAFTLELLRSGRAEWFRSLVVGIESATALDDTTIRVSYGNATATALLNLAHIPILPRHVFSSLLDGTAQVDEIDAQAVTAGPFRVAHYEDGFVLLERHEGAYGPKPQIERIAWTHYRSDETMVADLRSGVIDAIDDPSGIPADFESLQRDPSVDSWRGSGAAFWYVGFNSNPAKEKHRELLLPEVRKALSMAIDRGRIVREVLGGMGEPADTIVPPVLGQWRGSPDEEPVFDVEEAERLLDEAGFPRGPDGIRETADGSMRYVIQVSEDIPAYHRVFRIIREGWREIGVEVSADFLDSTPMNDAVMGPGKTYQDCDIFLWCWVLTILDPQAIFRVLVSEERGALNDAGFSVPEYDELYRRQAHATDEGDRVAIVREMEAIVREQLPYMPLCFLDSVSAFRSEWSGLSQTPLGLFPVSSKIPYLSASRARAPNGRGGALSAPREGIGSVE